MREEEQARRTDVGHSAVHLGPPQPPHPHTPTPPTTTSAETTPRPTSSLLTTPPPTLSHPIPSVSLPERCLLLRLPSVPLFFSASSAMAVTSSPAPPIRCLPLLSSPPLPLPCLPPSLSSPSLWVRRRWSWRCVRVLFICASWAMVCCMSGCTRGGMGWGQMEGGEGEKFTHSLFLVGCPKCWELRIRSRTSAQPNTRNPPHTPNSPPLPCASDGGS